MGPSRFQELDGLRGLAALIVVIWHIVAKLFPGLALGRPFPATLEVEIALFNSPVRMLYDGTLAVCIFFVLSGYVLSYSFFERNHDASILHRLIARPVRLCLPVTINVLVAFIFLSYGMFLLEGQHVTWEATGALEFIAPFEEGANRDLSPKGLIEHIFYLPYFPTPDFARLYNGVLWTMHVEFLGSLALLGLLLCCHRVSDRIVLSALAFCAILITFAYPWWGSYFSLLFIGSMLSFFAAKGYLSDRKVIWIPSLVVGLFLVNDGVEFLYESLIPYGISGRPFFVGLGACMVFVAVLCSAVISRILRGQVFQFLGRISFSLYLFHPLLFFTGYATFVTLFESVEIWVASLVAGTVVLIVSILVAALLTPLIDNVSVRASKAFSNRVVAALRPS